MNVLVTFMWALSSVTLFIVTGSGNGVNITVMVWVLVVTLPALSVAFQVTIVVPIGNLAGALLDITGFGSSLSRAVALPMFSVKPAGSSVFLDMSFGIVKVGGAVSGNIQYCAPVLLFTKPFDMSK